jgi:hypothetical protein
MLSLKPEKENTAEYEYIAGYDISLNDYCMTGGGGGAIIWFTGIVGIPGPPNPGGGGGTNPCGGAPYIPIGGGCIPMVGGIPILGGIIPCGGPNPGGGGGGAAKTPANCP